LRALAAVSVGAQAVGAVAFGALAVGALAIGALAVGAIIRESLVILEFLDAVYAPVSRKAMLMKASSCQRMSGTPAFGSGSQPASHARPHSRSRKSRW
jgi:hypothetical protein